MPTNPPRPPAPQTKAAALKYDRAKDAAPMLTAKGRGAVAERIIEVAKANNIPIQSDADLVEILEKVEIDTEIPLEVYTVVAEIFSFLYKANAAKKAS
ncbi:MAG: EscU/YscU/HrcU family type III secretion system export apparatus switch protein [Alphaproteobacteria bacterium]